MKCSHVIPLIMCTVKSSLAKITSFLAHLPRPIRDHDIVIVIIANSVTNSLTLCSSANLIQYQLVFSKEGIVTNNHSTPFENWFVYCTSNALTYMLIS